MANGIQILPTRDRFAGLRQGALNFVGGLNQQSQVRNQLSDQQALAQFIQQTQGGQQPGLPGLQTPGAGNALLQFLGSQQNPQEKELAAAKLAQVLAQTKQFGLPVSGAPGSQLRDPVTGGLIGEPIPFQPRPPITASQQISQKKLDRINQLQQKEADGTATENDSRILDKMLAGVSPVQINFGRSTASERTAIAETNASLDAVNNLETLFNNPNTRTGPIKGRLDPITGLAGLTSDEQENFMAATSAFKNKVIKDITGAQMSEAEAKRIMKQIPDITDPPARWKAKLDQTRRNLKLIQKRRSEVLEKSGIVSPLTGRSGKSNIRTDETKALTDEELLRIIGGQ